jgi:hypothetical protein
MAKLSICFSTDPHSWVSRIIRWFTKSQCSHAFIMVEEDPTFGTLIVESDSGGVQVTTPARFDFKTNAIVGKVTPEFDLLPALRAAMDEELGWSYDFWGLIGMAWVEFCRWLKVKAKNPLHKSKTLFCSAFVVTVLQKANVPGADALVPWDTDAQMLWDWLRAADDTLFV